MAVDDEEVVKRCKDWMRQHKIWSTVIVILLLFVGVFAWNMISASTASLFGFSSSPGAMESSVTRESLDRGIAVEDEGGGSGDEFQVRTGHATVESDDAAADADTFRSHVTTLNGEIEESEKFTSETEIRYHLTARIPVAQFDSFAEWLRDTYNVEDMSLRTETVSVEQQRNQVAVLREALNTYNNLLAKLNRSSAEEIDADTVNAIAEITAKKQEVARELERLGYSIGEVEEQAAMATVRVTFHEEKPVNIAPEDTTRRFRLAWKDSVDDFMDTAAELSAVPVTLGELLLQVVKYVLYAFVVVVPVYFAYRGLRWVIRKLSRVGR